MPPAPHGRRLVPTASARGTFLLRTSAPAQFDNSEECLAIFALLEDRNRSIRAAQGRIDSKRAAARFSSAQQLLSDTARRTLNAGRWPRVGWAVGAPGFKPIRPVAESALSNPPAMPPALQRY